MKTDNINSMVTYYRAKYKALDNVVSYAKNVDYTHLCMMLALTLVAVVGLALPEMAAATTTSGDPMSQKLCAVTGVMGGPVARGVGVIAIVFLGISLFLGKISWGLALAIGMGLAAIFGAPQLIKWFGAGTDACDATNVIT